MKIGNGIEYLEIIELDRRPEPFPDAGDVQVMVVVQLGDFRGMYDELWLEKREMQSFITAFEELLTVRKGKIRLKSMSPDEFWMEIRNTDNVGHMEVEMQLKKLSWAHGHWRSTMVAGEFDFDPGMLDSIFKDFRGFIEKVRHANVCTVLGNSSPAMT